MIRYLTEDQVLKLHRNSLILFGGSDGVLDFDRISYAVWAPQQTFTGIERFKGLAEKAAAIGFYIGSSHPFVDGNKRTARAAMNTFLKMNDAEIVCNDDISERMMLDLADGKFTIEGFIERVSLIVVIREVPPR